MKNFKCEDVINKIQWNQLRIAIRDDLPENALAGAFGDTIVLSKKLIQMVKNGLISKLSFLFIFLHEIAHIAQQALLSKKLLNADVAEFIRLHRIFLEKNANEIARRLICEGVWRKVVALIDFNTCECAKPYAYDSLSVQWWMVDGILSEAYMAEDPQEGGKADDIKNEVKIAIANVKNDDEIKKELEKVKKDEDIILFEDAEKFSNQIFDMQSAAIEEGIHETYARDALAEFEKNCNGHIDANSKAQNIKLKFNNADNGGRYYLIEKNGEVIHKINRESFVEGAQWNDRWHYCNARFALKFKVVSKDCTLKDAFIYSSHLKRMQFLHSMDCSNGSKLFNYKKIKRWAEFCIDVFNNIEVPIIKAPASNNEVQKNKHEASVNDIKTSTTENESTAKDVETPATENESLSNKNERLIYKKHIQDMTLDEYVNVADDELFRIMMRDLLDSAYGSKTIRYFLGGDKFDAGSVALGCVTHMIQDSFATSHVKRSLDPFVVRQPLDYYDSIEKRKQRAKSSNISSDVSLDEPEEPSLNGNPMQVEDYKFNICKKNVKKDKAGWSYEEYYNSLVEQVTPIILYANYEKQESKKHAHADIFLTHINTQKANGSYSRKIDDALHEDFYKQTLNATMARDCSEMFAYMAAMGYPKEKILKFFDSIYLSFDSHGKTTESGLQYCLKNVVENKYEAVIESLLCYNFNEALVNRIITFGRVIILLEGVINRTPKKEKKRRNECLHHICELSNEIFSWTYLLARGCIQDPKTWSFCAKSACEINSLANRIESVLNKIKKDANYLDDENVGETKEYIEDSLNNRDIYSKLLNKIIHCKILNDDENYVKITEKFGTEIGTNDKCLVVQIITGNKWDAGTDANVYLKIYGKIKEKNGKLKTVLIGKYPIIDNIYNSFERCSVEIFEFYTDKDVYEITSITIGHDGKWCGDKWYVKDIIVSMPLNSVEKGWIFNVDSGIDKNEEMVFAAHSLEKMRYFSLKVYTGYEVWAGTDSDIYISVFAKKGEDVVELETKKLDDVTNNFEIGFVDFFTFESQFSIDDICKIKLSNDGSDDWYVDKVVIADVVTEKTWAFDAKQWVTNDIDLCLSREEGCNFIVDVYTGEQSCGGTDSSVFITIIGNEGESKETELNDIKDNFEQGCKDSFRISTENSIGEVVGVKITKKGGGKWFLDKIVITDTISGKKKKIFANCEIVDNESVSLPNPNQKSCFAIDVYTGTESNAGTDNDISIVIHGKNGKEIPKQNLDNSKNNFENGKKDSFTITSEIYIDEIDYIVLYKEGNDDWFLDKVSVKNLISDEEEVKVFVADCLIGKNGNLRLPKEELKSWFTVNVYTSNKSNAGTDDDVFISIHGKNGNEIPKQQLDTSKNNFEKGDKDTFTVTSDEYIDEIDYIKMYKDGGDDWILEKVVVKNEKTKKVDVFVPNRKIGKNNEPFYPHDVRQSFVVDVYTGEEFGSGTNDDVFISIYGEFDKIEDYQLDDLNDNFERGKKDSFVVSSDKPIGDIKKIKVRLKGNGTWLLYKIVVTDIATNEEWVFMSNQRFENNEVELVQEIRTRLNLDIYTSCDSFAGTDDKIKIALYGVSPDGKFDREILPYTVLDNLHNNFEKGNRDSFILYILDDFENIKEIGIIQEGSDKWILDKIVVTDVKTEKVKVFATNEPIGNNKEVRLREQMSLVNFKIDVYTSNQLWAGTDGDVKIAIYGKDDLEILPFTKLDNSENNFERHDKDSFVVSTPKAENHPSPKDIKCIKIKQSSYDEWILDKIVITDLFTKIEWTFVPIPSEKIVKNEEVVIDRCDEGYCFLMEVYTSDKSFAGTDGKIEVALLGKDNVVILPYTKMNNFKNNFEKNDVDTFTFSTESFADDICGVKIKYVDDADNADDDWHLDKIIIYDAITKIEWKFIANSWIRKGEEITLSQDKNRHFVVDVYTDGNICSGTDGTVEISIDGKKKVLDNRHNNFEAGDRDSFTIHFDEPFINQTNEWTPCVEILYNAVDEWKPAVVIISDLNSSRQWVFNPEKIKDKKEFRLIPCKDYSCFRVDVYTSDETGGGTNANIRMVINGDNDQKLLNDRKNNFESGDIDSFVAVYKNAIGKPSCITLWNDGSGANADWKLGKIVVTDIVNGEKWVFPAGDDCWIKANDKKTLTYQEGLSFIIDLPKSDKKVGADDKGINAEISIVGEGDCVIPFKKIDDKNFIVMTSASEIKSISKIVIKKCDDKFDLDCIVGEITVTDIHLGKKWIFNCTDFTDKNNQVELEPTEIID